jgi:short-subunit dehydrogenase
VTFSSPESYLFCKNDFPYQQICNFGLSTLQINEKITLIISKSIMNIIITGGSNGIGKEIALYLAEGKNNKILITGRDQGSLSSVADAAANRNIEYFAFDLARLYLSPEKFKTQCLTSMDSVDILINNAGSLYSERFDKISDQHAREMMEVNFFAPVLIIRSLLPYLNSSAHIVNISSMGGFQGSVKYPGLSYYSASKAALAVISECIAAELREKRISINCLALGSVQTEMLGRAFPGFKAPVTATEMGKYIGDFAMTGGRIHNGKIIPVALGNP